MISAKLYGLPGLGADHRLFSRLDLSGFTPTFLDWPVMPKGSALRDYALALSTSIDATVPHALVGVSMGGMVAQELAGITHPEKVIIISSWKGPQEMPPTLKLMRGTHPERLLSKAFMKRTLPFVRWQMGLEGPASMALFDELLHVHTLEQLKVQINACLTWDGPPEPVPHLTHIHGDNDLLMPLAHIDRPVVVKGGGHFMVFDRATEVQTHLIRALH
ncbi:MAG: alpha/beta hydrolase [Flavobacteriales bacterium]|nr:alpha/beta hydrolase [Flavobacteriales bacterium]